MVVDIFNFDLALVLALVLVCNLVLKSFKVKSECLPCDYYRWDLLFSLVPGRCCCWVPAGVTVTNDVILNNVGMGGFVEFEHYKSHYVCVQLKDHVTLNLTKLSTQNIKYF